MAVRKYAKSYPIDRLEVAAEETAYNEGGERAVIVEAYDDGTYMSDDGPDGWGDLFLITGDDLTAVDDDVEAWARKRGYETADVKYDVEPHDPAES